MADVIDLTEDDPPPSLSPVVVDVPAKKLDPVCIVLSDGDGIDDDDECIAIDDGPPFTMCYESIDAADDPYYYYDEGPDSPPAMCYSVPDDLLNDEEPGSPNLPNPNHDNDGPSNLFYNHDNDDDGDRNPEPDGALSDQDQKTPRSQSKKRQIQKPSYMQTGEQPLLKKLFGGKAPRWNPARKPLSKTVERPLPNLEYKPADKAPTWIKNTTPITSRKARRMQLRL